ncbi:MAG: hypothetical protein ABS79_00240 [Planctomycetes bacterium SCN 63-9]|nr:MAG: hypothetical protein ABS79_00240 [Planctomycetes bacterium SCN 63-9]
MGDFGGSGIGKFVTAAANSAAMGSDFGGWRQSWADFAAARYRCGREEFPLAALWPIERNLARNTAASLEDHAMWEMRRASDPFAPG